MSEWPTSKFTSKSEQLTLAVLWAEALSTLTEAEFKGIVKRFVTASEDLPDPYRSGRLLKGIVLSRRLGLPPTETRKMYFTLQKHWRELDVNSAEMPGLRVAWQTDKPKALIDLKGNIVTYFGL
jgi:hypothetical protein